MQWKISKGNCSRASSSFYNYTPVQKTVFSRDMRGTFIVWEELKKVNNCLFHILGFKL